MAQAYEQVGDIPKAFLLSKRYHALKDSTFNADAATAANNTVLAAEFQREQIADSVQVAVIRAKEQAEAQADLDRERTRRNVFLFSGIGLLVFGIVVYRQRGRIKKEHERSEELLLNILPEEVAAELKAKGSADAHLIEHVTVLFTDFKGFTAMSEQLTPKELVRDIHECFSAFDRIMEKHGIEKIKTIGDAYMAAGGLPTPNTTHALDVVKAALEIRDFIAEGKARKVAAGLPYFEIRIGIHTGPVVAGIVGVKKFAYDIWGDTVNIASRMESTGEVGQVNISGSTYALVKDKPRLKFTSRGKVQAKGKGEMEMYFVDKT
ncbi:MAG: adenylate/guanylate cyclase domain-containing protein [Flavobacteriales bacterium]|nr:adenylate/guanylate cyclase domain-containing protein [Flavobacteriales bacterium]